MQTEKISETLDFGYELMRLIAQTTKFNNSFFAGLKFLLKFGQENYINPIGR
jgi:hypothetical protein